MANIDPPITSVSVPPVRSLFTTKTAFAQYVLGTAGVLTAFFPNAVPWVNAHAGEIMIVASLVGLLIRKLTHGRVQLFASSVILLLLMPVALVACSADHQAAVQTLRNPARAIVEQHYTPDAMSSSPLIREAESDDAALRILALPQL